LKMAISLLPRIAPPGSLCVWLGLFGHAVPPQRVSWFLDGKPDGVTVRPVQGARQDAWLAPGEAHAFTAIHTFGGLASGAEHLVRAVADYGGGIQEVAELRTRTLPAAVPAMMDGQFNVLLVSCFHRLEDPRGFAGEVVSQLKGFYKPHLTLLLGDQVYLDLPTLKNFPEDIVPIARRFEADYTANWRADSGYARLMAAAPTAAIPDDHEYWNNFPHPSPFIENSWRDPARSNWQNAARAMYEAFQYTPQPSADGDVSQLGDAAIIDVSPLSFFVADARTWRAPDRSRVLTARAHAQLSGWVGSCIAQRKLPLFVIGQSMLESETEWIKGKIADHALADYGDYDAIVHELKRLVDAGLPLVLITGDVHWGRITRARHIETGRLALFEVISSPSSLVTTIGADQWNEFKGALGGLFHRPDPWPRHSDPNPPVSFAWQRQFGERLVCDAKYPPKCNHVALLSFSRNGSKVEMRPTYFSIHEDAEHRGVHAQDLITLHAG
jgi:hypothetical protein